MIKGKKALPKNFRSSLVKKMKDIVLSCENWIEEKCVAKSAIYNKVAAMTKEDLLLNINEEGLTMDLVKARLEGKDIATPEWQTRCLWDEEFNMDEYKLLGENDGELRVAQEILSMLGEEEWVSRAAAAMYTNNF